MKKLEQIDGIWVPTEMHMTTKKGKTTLHKTIIKAHDVRFNQDLDEDLFTRTQAREGPLARSGREMSELARSVAPALLALLLTTFLAAGAAPQARCDDDLDDVLGGFDDEAGDASEGFVEDSDSDDVLGGFDDDLGEEEAPSEAEGAEDASGSSPEASASAARSTT